MGLLAAALLLLAGMAVGATGIGGVLVVPVLTRCAGIGTEQAIAASSFGFALTGAAAFWGPRGDPGSGAGWPLLCGALLGAALGALTLSLLPASGVRTGVGLLAVGSGAYALAGAAARSGPALQSGAALAALGLLVGCVSAWSGTGGPVVLLPLLTLLRWPGASALAAAQRIQLPVALAATAVHAAAGRLDLALGLAVGALVLAGWLAGQALARRVPTRRLQQAVAVALIAAGLSYL